MIQHDIIFVIGRETSSYFHVLEEDVAASTLVYYLNEYCGVKDIAVFPDEDKNTSLSIITESLENFLKEHTAPLFAVSSWTSTFRISMDFVRLIKKYNPEAEIVAGGPHFSGIKEIEDTLRSYPVDIIFRGGAEPFLDYIKNGNLNSKGVYYLENNKLKGSGRGTFGYPVVPVIGITDNIAEMRIMLNDSCPNGCDYCVINHSQTKKQYLHDYEASLAETVDLLKGSGYEVDISLSDSSPFNTHNRANVVKTLRNIQKRSKVRGFNVLLDPLDIDNEFYALVEEFDINTFFVGRDRVVEDSFIGRKHNGIQRKNADLDKENIVVRDFIEFLMERKTSLPQEVYIGYILSPYEQETSSLKMINEISDYNKAFSIENKLRVQASMFILNPYPGTKVAERADGAFIPMDRFYYPYPNAWLRETDVISSYIEIVRLLYSKVIHNTDTSFVYPLLRLAHDIQYGNDYDFDLFDEVDDKALRTYGKSLAGKVIDMDLNNISGKTYYDKLIELYYMGGTLSVMLDNPSYIPYEKQVMEKVIEQDNEVFFLKKDIEMLKEVHSMSDFLKTNMENSHV